MSLERDNFTGFVVITKNGRKIYEKENYYSKKQKKVIATNWSEIDKSKINILQLYWKGKLKAQITKDPSDLHKHSLKPEDWYFSHRAYFDTNTLKIKIISRNIGFIENDLIYIISVLEENGTILYQTRIKNS